MDTSELLKLIQGGENLLVEFKGELGGQLNDKALLEAVVCLANGHGGRLLVGVEDDGVVTGARPRHGIVTDESRVRAMIANRTRPSLVCGVDLVALERGDVLIISVPKSEIPVGTSDGLYVRRTLGGDGKPACVPYLLHEVTRQASWTQQDYTALLIDAGWEDLDPLEFERYRRLIRESRGLGDAALAELSDLELSKALGIIDVRGERIGIRVAALLLFGKEGALRKFLPTHEIAFQVLSGTQVEVNEFVRWPLLRAIDDILLRFRARNKEQELLVGAQRIGIPDYPERAFREGLANALIHRDYTAVGAVHIVWHDAELEISNPGGFPEGVRVDNLLVTPPRPRNPLLADAVKRAGLVERTGRGVDTIFLEQLRNGRPAPSYERSTDKTVHLSLTGGEANLEFVRLIVEEAHDGRRFTLDELLLLNELWYERNLTQDEARQLIQKGEAVARATLERLVEGGLVDGRSSGRGRTYHLSATTYQRMAEGHAYIRQRGFDALQQEQMIMQYVDEYGSISRSEAATLCKVSLPQAYRVLLKLVDKGLILAPGTTGRGARYYKKDSQNSIS